MIDRPANRTLLCALALAAGLTIGGCSVGTLNGLISSDTPDSEHATGATTPPAVNMAGRWVLATPGVGQCRMNFSAAPGAREGAVAPEGGCPGNFFTSREWAIEHNAVILRDNDGELLAQLNVAEPGRLEGQSATGERVTLTR